MTFPALEISPSGLVVWAAAMISPIGHYTPAVIDLPALTAALALEIHGNISRFVGCTPSSPGHPEVASK